MSVELIKHVTAGLRNAIRNLASFGKISNAKKGFAQVDFGGGEVRDNIKIAHHYGFSSVPSDGSWAVVVFPGGNHGQGVALASDNAQERPKLEKGETALWTKEIVIKLDKDKKLSITGAEEVELKGAKNVKIEGSEAIELKGAKNVKIEGSEAIELKGAKNVKIEGSQSIELNGNSKQFVTWTELNTALTSVLTKISTHTHPATLALAGSAGPVALSGTATGATLTSPALAALACDISAAKTTTIKTGG